MVEYRYISADSHCDLVWCPAEVYQDRVPSKFRDQAPHVEWFEGQSKWVWEDEVRFNSNLVPPSKNSASEHYIFDQLPEPLPAGALPPSDPKLLLEHMDLAHIYTSVLYGPVGKPTFKDPELAMVCNQAWNDFMCDFSGASPERIIALPNLPTWDPSACIGELERIASRGLKGVEFSIHYAPEGVWSPIWEPVWDFCEDAGIVIGFHIGRSVNAPRVTPQYGRASTFFSLTPFSTQEVMGDIVFSGVLDRHPGLKVVFGECRVGWLEFYIEHCDRQQSDRATEVPLKLKPSEYWQRQMAATWEDDAVGTRIMRDRNSHIAKIAMWGADYPHNVVSWPFTDELLNDIMVGVAEDVRFDAVAGRASEFYQITLPTSEVSSSDTA